MVGLCCKLPKQELYCPVLSCTVLYCTILYCTAASSISIRTLLTIFTLTESRTLLNKTELTNGIYIHYRKMIAIEFMHYEGPAYDITHNNASSLYYHRSLMLAVTNRGCTNYDMRCDLLPIKEAYQN
uniref:Uncharacterized protein n=1 Tax=Glossina brevipalpis TaxID=37001 RepID=A0A1A9W248_9MUSC